MTRSDQRPPCPGAQARAERPGQADGEPPARARGRRRRRWPGTWPATIVIGVAVVAIGIALAPQSAAQHRDLVARLGVTPRALTSFRWWTLAVSPVVQSDPGIGPLFWSQAVAVVASLALLEPRAGSVRTAALFFGSELFVEPVRLASLAGLARLGNASAEALVHVGDTGSSAAVTAVAAAFVTTLPSRLARAGYVGLALWIAWSVHAFPLDVAIDHAAGAACGLLVAAWWRWRRTRAAAATSAAG